MLPQSPSSVVHTIPDTCPTSLGLAADDVQKGHQEGVERSILIPPLAECLHMPVHLSTLRKTIPTHSTTTVLARPATNGRNLRGWKLPSLIEDSARTSRDTFLSVRVLFERIAPVPGASKASKVRCVYFWLPGALQKHMSFAWRAASTIPTSSTSLLLSATKRNQNSGG